MTLSRIGIEPTDFDFVIKAGARGGKRFDMVMTNQDGTALPTYDGWTAVIVFRNPYNGSAVLTKDPTVSGDAGTKTLTFDLSFDPEDTINLPIATYEATVWLTDPSSGETVPTEPPAVLTLKVEPHG